jgi:hypothetical protein
MRRHRGTRKLELGEAISFEDVLTVITVLLLLRVLFMVPLVNLDKAKTERAQIDAYWGRHAGFLLAQPEDSASLRPYRTAFDLHGGKAVLSERGPYLFIEAAMPDSNLLVVRQRLADSSYIAMRVQGPGHAKTFRRGRLLWSPSEGEWFTAADTVDYGSHPLSKGLEGQLRQYTKNERGY